MQRQDVGVAEAGGGRDLAEKALPTERGGELWGQYLDGHRPTVLQVFGQVHGRHPAATELALDRVPPGEGGAHFGEHIRHGGARARGTLDDMSQGGTGPEGLGVSRLLAQPRVTSPTSLS